MTRNCPKCKCGLSSKVDADLSHRCDLCGGLWLREQTFRTFVRKCLANVPDAMISLQEAPVAPTRYPCPDCRTVMLERVKLRAVEVERCGRCHRLFLDRGEVGLIVRRVRLAVNQLKEKRPPARTPRLERILSTPLR